MQIRQDHVVVEFGARRLVIVAGVMAAALMQTLDTTITNVALPTIQGNLGASQDEATWVVTAYTIASIVVIPLTPWLQNRYGRKKYFVSSIVGFTIASVACGFSGTLVSLIAFRVVQGAFGGGLLATGQAILRDTFPPKQLSASQGLFTIAVVLGPALGPPLGGVLVDDYSWNWCFDINVLPGVLAAVVLLLLLKDPKQGRATPVDFVGLALLALTLGGLQYVLTEGEQNYWFQDPTLALATAVAVVSFACFIVYELRMVKHPIVDLRVLSNRSCWAGTVLAFALGGFVVGTAYTIPQYTQGVLGFTPTLSGVQFLVRAIPVALCTPFIVRFVGKVDARILLGTGFVVSAIANVAQASITTLQAGFWTFGVSLVLSGVGAAMLFLPLSVAVLRSTTPQDGPKAGSFVNLSLQLGGSVSVVLLDVIIHKREEFHSSILSGSLTLGNPVVRAFLQSQSIPQLAHLVYTQSTVLSYADASLAIALIMVMCTPLIFLMRGRSTHVSVSEIEMGG